MAAYNLTPEQVNQLLLKLQQAKEQLEVAATSVAPVTVSTHQEPRIDNPIPFDGDKARTESFLAQLNIHFELQSTRFPNDRSKVLFAISNMKGMAFDWALPYLRANHDILQDYNVFVTNLKVTFGNINCPRQAERELLELKQGHRSAVEYIADFQRLSLEVGWTETPSLCAMFDKGLNRKIKQALCNFQRPDTLAEYFRIVAELDNRHIEFCQEFREDGIRSALPPISNYPVPTPSDGVADMIIGAAQRRRPLTSNKHQQRMDHNLCLYCGEEGHIIKACPKLQGCKQQQQPNRNLVGATKLAGFTCPYLTMDILQSGKPISTVHALVDSGADRSLLSESLLHSLHLTPQILSHPLQFENIEGNPLSSGSVNQFVVLDLQYNSTTFSHTFYVIHSLVSPIVLGIDWLTLFNPLINWATLSVTMQQPTVPITCATHLTEIDPIADDGVVIEEDLGSIQVQLPLEYHEFTSVFSEQLANILPQHRKFDIGIDLQEGKKVPWGPIYPLSEIELKTLRTYLDEQLTKGFICPSKSPAGAPIFFVKKKSGELHPVIDYWGLNSITVKNRYPLPLIHEMLHRFSCAKIFTKIDLRGAYNLVRIREGDEWKTAFCCRFGHFEYTVMPFGLTNAPAIFQNLMNEIFFDYLDLFCIVYLDDILIYSETPAEHTKHVKLILQRLQDNMLYAKLEKCAFSVTSIDFLGYIISDSGIGVDPNKVKSITSWPAPTNIKSLQSFLGFANFYRMFILGYSHMIAPMLTLLKKDSKFIWTPACQTAFENLKSQFSTAPILRHPDTSKPFIVETDASDFAIGGILSQEFNGQIHPIAYYSCKLSAPEINYEVHDKELLAIVACFQQWHSFLLSTIEPVQVLTDHRNLLYFSESKKLNRRQVRWSLFLCNFDFRIIFRPGREGGKPDALSQQQDYQLHDSDEQVTNQHQVLLHKDRFALAATRECSLLEPSLLEHSLLEWIKCSQVDDAELHHIRECKDILDKNGCLFRYGRAVVPQSLQHEVLQLCHDSPLGGHMGIHKTFQRVSKEFWWPGMRKDCKAYVESCHVCERAKAAHMKPAGLLHPLPVPPRPWHSVAMDFIVDLPTVQGKNSILVIVDRFSKMGHFIACTKDITSVQLADLFFYHVIRLHGIPNNLVTDCGSVFISQFFSALLTTYGIEQNLTSAYHPQSDGQTERLNQVLEQYLCVYSNFDQTNWLENLPLAEFCYNSHFHTAINMSPFKATYGFDPPVHWSTEVIPDSPPTLQEYMSTLNDTTQTLHQTLEKTQLSTKHFADTKCRHVEYEEGEMVFLDRCHIKTSRPSLKLDWKKLGPFQIIQKINPVAYRLQLPHSMKRLHNVFHISLLHPVKKTYSRPAQADPPPVILDRTDNYYEVEDILDGKQIKGKWQFLVSWKGYSAKENSWEPEENILNCTNLIEDFKKRFGSTRKSAARGASVRN